MDFQDLLKLMVEKEASDLLVTVRAAVTPVGNTGLTREAARKIVEGICTYSEVP